MPPSVKTIWDVKPKLVFRDFSDSTGGKIGAYVDLEGDIFDNHFFSGGVNVVCLQDANGHSLLTKQGRALRDKFESDHQFLYFLAGILNSNSVQLWSAVNSSERVAFPSTFDINEAKAIASLEEKLGPVWLRTEVGRIADLQKRQDDATEIFLKSHCKAK